jgi:hypothetical protein
MTMTTSMPDSNSAPQPRAQRIEWRAVQAGLWVGKTEGEFAGMIEAHWGEGFVATTRLAKTLGTFATVEEAKSSFATQ